MADVYEFSSEEDRKSGRFRISRKWLVILLLFLLYMLIRFLIFFKLDWTWFNVLGYVTVFGVPFQENFVGNNYFCCYFLLKLFKYLLFLE